MDLRTISGDCIERLKKFGFKWKSSQAESVDKRSKCAATCQSTTSRGCLEFSYSYAYYYQTIVQLPVLKRAGSMILFPTQEELWYQRVTISLLSTWPTNNCSCFLLIQEIDGFIHSFPHLTQASQFFGPFPVTFTGSGDHQSFGGVSE